MPDMQELKTLPEYLKASNAPGVHILEATAPWCSQCKALAPFVDKLMAKYPEAKFYSYDTDTALDIAQELHATQMPTFHLFRDGDLMDSLTGNRPQALEAAIAKYYDGKVQESAE